MDEGMISCLVEKLMSNAIDRNVEVNLNKYLLQDTGELISIIDEIIATWK